jgi:hypothetical protein
MAKVVEIKGLSSLINKLNRMTARLQKDQSGSVVVGYTAPYAIFSCMKT